MHLTLAHRLTALNLLPSEGTFVTLRTVRDAQHALSPSPDEIARFQITQDGNQVRWVGDSTAAQTQIKMSSGVTYIRCGSSRNGGTYGMLALSGLVV